MHVARILIEDKKYNCGDILMWSLKNGDAEAARERIMEMEQLLARFSLGDGAATSYGLNFDRWYFEVTLAREISEHSIITIFNEQPAHY